MNARMRTSIAPPYRAPPISPYDPTISLRVFTRSMKQYSENTAKAGRSSDEKSIPPFSKLQLALSRCEDTLWGGKGLLCQQMISRAIKLLSSLMRSLELRDNSLDDPLILIKVFVHLLRLQELELLHLHNQ